MKRAVLSEIARFLIPAVFALAIAQTAQAREAPILSLDPGGHMSFIRAVLFTPDGKQLVSAGDDKVIRVWDVDAGQTVRILRGQIGDGSRGKIYALALSPDASLLAAGGRIREAGEGSNPIRLYNFRRARSSHSWTGIRALSFRWNSRPMGVFSSRDPLTIRQLFGMLGKDRKCIGCAATRAT